MNRLVLTSLAGLLLASSCRHDDLVIYSPAASSLAAANGAFAPAVQTFTVNLSLPQTLHTQGGATITFGANSLVLPNNAVATGMATLRVRELRTVGDMLLTGMHTNLAVSAAQLLVSGGEYNVQAWQGATRLRWSTPFIGTTPGTTGFARLSAPVPAAGLDTTRMFLWAMPLAQNAVVNGAADSVGWRPAIQGGTAGWPPVRPSGGFYNVNFPLDTISWLNFDQYWRPVNNANWTTARVRVPAGATETRVYLRPVGYTSLSRTFATSDPTLWQNHLPEGTDTQVIVEQLRDGQLYFGVERLTWHQNAVYAPKLQLYTAAEIAQLMQQL
ncbi:hypothetical protein [Hymenobacter properus]|uniref:Uncharacterized protein n=1 Tax=Hymenobacter properus TaxID=2791026 RepID=A0A931FNK2_9BACT|nr:hypothetical protein [Hymenobacter properus]MBF9144241.1 hypothetical protein [Hymenobacter properus]MBR7723059.1 hypothetical protein [Microvirga sp. SRT04]